MIRLNRNWACTLGAAGGSSIALLLALAAPVAAQDAPVADAGSDRPAPELSVSPLRFEFDKRGAGQTLRLVNTGRIPLVVQSRLFAWDQTGDAETFAPSRAVTISPAIANIAPGQVQIVRLIRAAPPSPGEKRFRLTIDQLPDPKTAQASTATSRLRFVLPLFMDRDQASPPQLSWRLKPGQLELSNSGGQTARLVNLQVTGTGGRVVPIGNAGLRYVHGGRSIAWKLPEACASGPVKVTADADGQAIDVQPAPCT